MRDRPSTTAALVAFARAAASAPPLGEVPFDDPVARELLPAPLRWALPRGRGATARAQQAVLRVATGGLVDHLALRSLAIDAAVRGAVRGGVTQLVILGAGLDARAHRMPELDTVTVYEVDHPASQAYKLARQPSLPRTARALVHVDVDFARQRMGERLAESGHDRGAPTAWVCEGVTMYLTDREILALLDDVAGASAAGSTLAVTYRSDAETPFPAPFMRVVGAVMTVMGEPFHAATAPERFASWVKERGFHPISDESSREWSARYGGSRRAAFLLRSERLLVATRLPI